MMMTANPIINMLGGMLGGGSKTDTSKADGLNSILGLFNTLKGSNNYMQALQSMSHNNPMIKQCLDYVEQNGGDAKAAFYKLAEQNGIDPNNILNMIK